MHKLFLGVFFFLKLVALETSVDIVVFSYDRSMQLYALLESIDNYVKGYENIYIIYRTSSLLHKACYYELNQSFSQLNLKMISQEEWPDIEFKPLLMNVLDESKSSYILFAVDDNIVTDNIDLQDCCEVIDSNKDIHGVFLRLGRNITHSYVDIPEKTLEFKEWNNWILMWTLLDEQGYWGYHNCLDMTIYRKKQVQEDLKQIEFTSPNTLETAWSQIAPRGKYGSCLKHSVVANIPVNLVQENWKTPCMNTYSIKYLLSKFKRGLKIDISKFYKINNNCPHAKEKYLFVKREY